MTAESDLGALLARMQPRLIEGEYVFCSVPHRQYGELAELTPLASYQEVEGLSLLLLKQQADTASLSYDSEFRGITLSVHSSLEAVGLTAAVRPGWPTMVFQPMWWRPASMTMCLSPPGRQSLPCNCSLSCQTLLSPTTFPCRPAPAFCGIVGAAPYSEPVLTVLGQGQPVTESELE
jgi:hypothetical protein